MYPSRTCGCGNNPISCSASSSMYCGFRKKTNRIFSCPFSRCAGSLKAQRGAKRRENESNNLPLCSSTQILLGVTTRPGDALCERNPLQVVLLNFKGSASATQAGDDSAPHCPVISRIKTTTSRHTNNNASNKSNQPTTIISLIFSLWRCRKPRSVENRFTKSIFS